MDDGQEVGDAPFEARVELGVVKERFRLILLVCTDDVLKPHIHIISSSS